MRALASNHDSTSGIRTASASLWVFSSSVITMSVKTRVLVSISLVQA
ncbi:Uncharacterised protein [Mycobacteroides abscessus subsp. abscessus]|nr:Uncharacterised protein [Mycobacteroides abscessus subsp. abscessus]